MAFAPLIAGGLFAAAYWMSKKGKRVYDVAKFSASLSSEVRPYAALLLKVGAEEGVDPAILAGIMMRESRGGAALVPPGPAGKGDAGHGYGLMQIDDRSWGPWLASAKWYDPETNIRKGAQIYKMGVSFFSGRSKVAGLTDGTTVTVSMKAAAARGVQPGSYPDPRPLKDAGQLTRAAVAAYNTGLGNVLLSVAAGKDPDVTTAHADYASDVLAKATTYANGSLVA